MHCVFWTSLEGKDMGNTPIITERLHHCSEHISITSKKAVLVCCISLSVKSLFHSWQEEFYSTRLLQTEFFLNLTFYYISFGSFSHFFLPSAATMLFTLQNKNVSRSMKLCPECYRLTLSQSLLRSAMMQHVIPSQHFRFQLTEYKFFQVLQRF